MKQKASGMPVVISQGNTIKMFRCFIYGERIQRSNRSSHGKSSIALPGGKQLLQFSIIEINISNVGLAVNFVSKTKRLSVFNGIGKNICVIIVLPYFYSQIGHGGTKIGVLVSPLHSISVCTGRKQEQEQKKQHVQTEKQKGCEKVGRMLFCGKMFYKIPPLSSSRGRTEIIGNRLDPLGIYSITNFCLS